MKTKKEIIEEIIRVSADTKMKSNGQLDDKGRILIGNLFKLYLMTYKNKVLV